MKIRPLVDTRVLKEGHANMINLKGTFREYAETRKK
jgi:hypothetical protein